MCRNWQTRQTQNLLRATAYGFKSHHRHEKGSECSLSFTTFFHDGALNPWGSRSRLRLGRRRTRATGTLRPITGIKQHSFESEQNVFQRHTTVSPPARSAQGKDADTRCCVNLREGDSFCLHPVRHSKPRHGCRGRHRFSTDGKPVPIAYGECNYAGMLSRMSPGSSHTASCIRTRLRIRIRRLFVRLNILWRGMSHMWYNEPK